MMKHRHLHHILRPLVYAGAVLAVAFAVKLMHEENSAEQLPYQRDFRLFGTYGRLSFWAEHARAEAAADDITAAMQDLHDMLNLFDKNSELAQLNRKAYFQPVVCSPGLWDAMQAARTASRLTDGAFDVSVGPLMEVWGFHRSRDSYPSEKEVATALNACGLDQVVFDDTRRTVKFKHPDTYLDFGGIAKGYALDLAVDIAREHGIRSGLIDLGGNVYCFPEPPPGRDSYTVGVRNPFEPDRMLQTLPLLGRAIATSGNYENYRIIEGRLVHHIIDPRTGYPVERTASVTTITPGGLRSDIYSTAIFVNGPELAESLTAENPRIGVLMIRKEGQEALDIKSWQWPVPTASLAETLTFSR